MQPKLSIIICAFNKINFTLKTINDLLPLDTDDFEIILVDNASTDGTAQKFQEINQKNFKLITNTQNLFHSQGCNQGFSIAQGERILFLNNDIKISSKDWGKMFIEAVDKMPDCLIGATGGLVDIKKDFRFVYETQDAFKPINYISGWLMGGTKKLFDNLVESKSVSPLDELLPMYYNDTDISFRATIKNYKLKLINLPISHIGKVSTSQFSIQKFYQDGKKTFTKKWKERKNELTQ